MPVYYPLFDDNHEIEASAVFAEDTMTMASLYNVSNTSNVADVQQQVISNLVLERKR